MTYWHFFKKNYKNAEKHTHENVRYPRVIHYRYVSDAGIGTGT